MGSGFESDSGSRSPIFHLFETTMCEDKTVDYLNALHPTSDGKGPTVVLEYGPYMN